ncbi:MAG TPA: phosphatidate cytidylyltransferase [Halanaerobiales bacterium]|nr:phosphatidate cytidylyltransferase [Halanaerobiales bacterium]
MLRERTISAIVLIVLIIIFIFWGSLPFLILLMFINIMGVIEYNRLINGKKEEAILLMIFSIIFILVTYLTSIDYLKGPISVMVYLFIFALIIAHFIIIKKVLLKTLACNLFGIIYLGAGLSFLFLLRDFSIEPFNFTRALWLVLLTTWAADIGAYFSGIYLGRNKLAPKISPNKTIEGALGGIILAVIIVFLLTASFGIFEIKWILYATITAIIGMIGDLFESKLKREMGIKDSGKLIPGHGGVLDRIDSLLFTAPFTYFYLLIFI